MPVAVGIGTGCLERIAAFAGYRAEAPQLTRTDSDDAVDAPHVKRFARELAD